ncbi:MAG: PocR ligand-binding domain-containing protein [Acidobacteriota bacterium]
MRHTGVRAIGDVPWGTHLCHFYENREDLAAILVPYFKAGIENNEFCLWAASEPFDAGEARAALAAEVPDLDDHIREGRIEIVDHTDWYTLGGKFDSRRVLEALTEKAEAAARRGLDGLRLAANTYRLEQRDWPAFCEHEVALDDAGSRYPILAICSYSLAHCGAAEVMDAVANHSLSLVKRAGEWRAVENRRRKRMEASLRTQHEWLRVTLSSIGDAVMATDTSGKVTFLNPVAAALTGWAETDALGLPVQSVLRLVNEDTREPGEDVVGRVLRERCVVEMANHTALVARDGREIPIEDSAAPIRDSAGNLAGVVLVFHDVTEKRRAQQALRESEARVRLKLESILSPEGHLENLELGDIIDAGAIQSLLEDFYRLAGIPMAIIDLSGKVLVGVGWQEICTKYHRVHSDACKNCIESDTQLSAGVSPGEFKLYKCKNNMWDVATPIMIGGEHVGNVFAGQFFFDNEPVDDERFRAQARRYGFDEAGYMSALKSVPRLSREAVDRGMSFLAKLGHTLSLLSYSNLKLARSLAERDALTASLKLSGATLNRAQEIAHLGSWELDVANHRLFWSDEVYRIFGLAPQEFGATYEAFLDLVHPDDRAAVDAAYAASLRDAKPYELTHRIVRRGSGEVRWVHEKCEHITSPEGGIVRSIGMVQDITERKRAEEELVRTSQQRRMALEAAELGAWDYRLDTGEVFWDERCRSIFGVSGSGSISYRDVINLIHPDDRSAVDDAVRRAIAGENGGAYHREFRVVWPDGSVHWMTSHGRVYFDGKDGELRPSRFVGANMDITQRKRAEENLRQAQKLESIGLLAGGIAHDFNNLLVGIIGNASLIEDMLPRKSPALEMLRRISQAGEHAANLTRQMLAYAGKGRFVLEPVDLSRIVSENISLMQSSISKKITWRLEIADGISAVESDPVQMQQVLMNLVLNAGEAIGNAPGLVTVATGEMDAGEAYVRDKLDGWTIEPGRYVFLEVSDTGCGMDDATRRQIFDPFFTTKFQGRGLGLAAVAGIVRAHGGAIELETAPGAGTRFRVLFPAAAASVAVSEPAAEDNDDLSGKGTVLVVDDEQIVRDLAKCSLERQGYEVLLAEDGPAAIEAVRTQGGRIRLVLLDLSMPGMSGEETLPRLRALKPDLDVVITSGYSRTETLRFFEGARVSGFIQKPYTAQELASVVKSALA